MNLNTLRDVYTDTLRDLYSAEQQIARALPKMAKAASTPELRKAFEQHLDVTKKQMERLTKVCEEAGIKAGGKKCEAMEGLLKEGEEIIKEKGTGSAKDAALIVAAQKVEHYEIAGYGSARTFAERLGMKQSARLLNQTLQEEGKTDERLTLIAEKTVNRCAEEEAALEKKPASAGNGALKGTSARGRNGSTARSAASKSGTTSKSSQAKSASSASSGRLAAASRSGASKSGASKSGSASSAKTGASASKSRSATSSRSKSAAAAKSRSAGASSRSKSQSGAGADATTDHDLIRQWVEERGGWPACVRGTGDEGDIGMLRIDFPGYSGEDSLERIEWDEFFEKFEEKGLAFLHQDQTADGETSRFFKLVTRDNSK